MCLCIPGQISGELRHDLQKSVMCVWCHNIPINCLACRSRVIFSEE